MRTRLSVIWPYRAFAEILRLAILSLCWLRSNSITKYSLTELDYLCIFLEFETVIYRIICMEENIHSDRDILVGERKMIIKQIPEL